MINIYTANSTDAAVSTDNSAPLITSHNRKRIHPDIRKLYVRNDDTAVWVSNLQIHATSVSVDLYSGGGNFGVKFYVGDLEPTDRVWGALGYNAPARLAPVGTVASADTSTFQPFWMRVEAGGTTPIALQQGSLVATYMEHAI